MGHCMGTEQRCVPTGATWIGHMGHGPWVAESPLRPQWRSGPGLCGCPAGADPHKPCAVRRPRLSRARAPQAQAGNASSSRGRGQPHQGQLGASTDTTFVFSPTLPMPFPVKPPGLCPTSWSFHLSPSLLPVSPIALTLDPGDSLDLEFQSFTTMNSFLPLRQGTVVLLTIFYWLITLLVGALAFEVTK